MKRYLSLFLVLLLFCVPSQVLARSHQFLNLEIKAQLGADGIVRVLEEHTVKFSGSFTGMFQWIDTRRGVKLGDVVVSENGIPYTRLAETKPGPAGTYYIEEKDNEVYVDWSFEATDEIRTFHLSYNLENVILKHTDVAEFYYNFVGSQWDKPRENVRVSLTLPMGAEKDEILAWGHGPEHGITTIHSGTEIIWEISPLPAKTALGGRVVFPNHLVPGATRLTNRAGLAKILAEESKEQAKIEAKQTRRKYDPYVAAVAIGLAYLLVVYLWMNFAKPYPGFTEKYYKKLPNNYPPAELGILYKTALEGRDLTATILDLGRRGFLTIQEVISLQGRAQREKVSYEFIEQGVPQESLATLQPYEEQVLALLFREMSQGQVSLEGFQSYVKQNRKKFNHFWQEWDKSVKAVVKDRQFFDEKAKKQALWFLFPGLIMLIGAFPLFILDMFLTGAVFLTASIIVLILVGVASVRRSPSGNLEYTKWRAFRRYLKHFSRLETARVASAGIWEEYLPYALTLGIAERVIKEWTIVTPDLATQGDLGFTWFVYTRGGLGGVSQMTNGINSSISSSMAQSGTGGSFSGGGGGGFGGGGGGVR